MPGGQWKRIPPLKTCLALNEKSVSINLFSKVLGHVKLDCIVQMTNQQSLRIQQTAQLLQGPLRNPFYRVNLFLFVGRF